MKLLQFKCTTLTDIILNQKAATEGHQMTLDFIPGSNFLGIVANQLYEALTPQDAWEIFHSGKVSFGDAHPGEDRKRALRVPTSMFHPKMKKEHELCYIHHYYHRENDHSDQGSPCQLKQCRGSFYLFSGNKGIRQNIQKSFAIKSAYDRDFRHSQDKQMYGYQSIVQGSTFYFEITLDDSTEKFAREIENSLVGEKRVGRSRSAQYGLIDIKSYDFENNKSNPDCLLIDGRTCVAIYADSRLIFIDEQGLPTFQPTPEQLNIPNGKILWEKSQIRTFQYAPWNFIRQSRDTDRCGIEKGSVIIVEVPRGFAIPTGEYLGLYRNEGFGKVIYNPDFLQAKTNTNGESAYTLQDAEETRPNISPISNQTPLLQYLLRREEEDNNQQRIYDNVNRFVKSYKDIFQGEQFASQWGAIRNIAIQETSKERLCNELFNKLTRKKEKDVPNAYLTHGVAASKWKERGRLEIFKKFTEALDNDIAQLTIINLASEMAKNCRRK